MSTPGLSHASPRPVADAELPIPVSHPGGPHPVALGLASGVLLWFAFPPAGWSWLGWVALTPLFLLVKGGRSRAAGYVGAWLGGLAFWLLALNWILCIDPAAALAWGVMATALSLLWPLFLALARAGTKLGLPLMIAAPVVWTAIEYVRAYLVTGFPWYYLAHSQYRQVVLIQTADFAGALGLSLLMAATSAFVADLLTLPLFRPTPDGPRLARPIARRAAVLGAALAATIGYGVFRVNTARFEPGPKVGLLQSSLMQRYKMGRTADEILAQFNALVGRAAGSDPRPDLIVWPETSYPYGMVAIDPAVGDAELGTLGTTYNPNMTAKDWREKRASIDAHLHGWVDAMGIPMLVGTTTYDFRPGKLDRYNSATLLEPGVATARSYHKIHLVPFGEYVPLISTFPWLTALTPYRNGHVPSLTFGGGPSWFDRGGLRFASAICFEDTVPQVVRRLFAEVPDGHPPDILFNLSNDGWFAWQDDAGVTHGSSEHEMHLAVSVFRAVEHRVPLARSANTGISAVVDGNGRVVARLESGKEGVLVASVPLDPRTGAYTRLGDWVGLGSLAVTIGLAPLAWWRRPKVRARVA